ncbi:chitin deacetylase family protein [Synechocystis salina]|uniref:Polysaccharide deacetylase family protein n=1 Tax=Synechocystis salina LEGE 00031 TaxID=1828736 RepID=A0ABR9VQA0_9SYNC|nr:chitin deacetylase family protein [Synechocystis salina]MBE9241791.1 polysaccharide deacetylase family protein [Synechocystis salina LEGE 00041]MBE9253487.1 polysaccharide deacetylase family protein [Synechocystis salina LEGE 00031]
MLYWLLLIIFAGFISILFFQPHWILAIIELLIPGVVYFAKIHDNLIALTIDDSPHSDTTQILLNILRENQVKATFFIISNQVFANEAIIQTMVTDGHELGNHMTEDKPSIKLSPEEFATDLLEAHSVISRFDKIHWFRPASGWYNSEMLKTAKKNGYRTALGSVFPYDTLIESSWFAVNYILFNIRPGSIIVLHDGNSRGQRTVKTLIKILPILKNRGYKFVTLSELFTKDNSISGQFF